MMKTLDEAREAIRQNLGPLPPRHAVLADNIGATLAEPLIASAALPATDVSAMDGYAVNGPGPWILRSDIQIAGATVASALHPGEAIRIGTGAQTPPGSTAVIRDEHIYTTTISDVPAIGHLPTSTLRDDTRRRGENWHSGKELAPAGLRVSPTLISVAASAETPSARIRGPLRAHVILTGDEIRTHGELTPGHTRDSLGPALPHYLRALDIVCTRLTHSIDHGRRIRSLLSDATDVDLVIVVGATRYGPADYLRGALNELNAVTVFDGIHCRPGGSHLLARIPDGPIVECLPGNPFAALAALVTIAPTIVDTLTLRTPRAPVFGHVTWIAEANTSTNTRILPATRKSDGTWYLTTNVHTPHLAGLVGCDALALIPPKFDPSLPVEIIDIPH